MIAAASSAAFGDLCRVTLLRERRRAVLDLLETGQRRGQVRTGSDVSVAVDAAYGALHHRLLLSHEPLDGPFASKKKRCEGGGPGITSCASRCPRWPAREPVRCAAPRRAVG